MLQFLWRRRISTLSSLLSQQYLDSRAVFMYLCNDLPSVAVITRLNGGDAFSMLKEVENWNIQRVWQHSHFDADAKELCFNITLIKLFDKRMIEIGPNYVELLYSPQHQAWAKQLLEQLAALQQPAAEMPIALAQPVTVLGFARRFQEN